MNVTAAIERVATAIVGPADPTESPQRSKEARRDAVAFARSRSPIHDPGVGDGCLCAGCAATGFYAHAQEYAVRGCDEQAQWRQEVGDAFFLLHQAQRAEAARDAADREAERWQTGQEAER